MWLLYLLLMRILNVFIQNYVKMNQNLSNNLLPLNACLLLIFFLISKFWNLKITKTKLSRVYPKLSFVSVHRFWAFHNPIHIWITAKMISQSNFLEKRILPMHRIQSLTKRNSGYLVFLCQIFLSAGNWRSWLSPTFY